MRGTSVKYQHGHYFGDSLARMLSRTAQPTRTLLRRPVASLCTIFLWDDYPMTLGETTKNPLPYEGERVLILPDTV
jgi:hypothetical protein